MNKALPSIIGRTRRRLAIRAGAARFSAPAVQKSNEDQLELHAVLEDLGKALTPLDTVEKLDQYIVGQASAKRAVAVAMRNRWRRQQLPDDLKAEIVPKNILMIGPTGCGKTEIARRISKISQAPFIKVEATKFTEVGFHGKDVDQIIKDLVEASITLTKKNEMERLQSSAEGAVEDRIIAELIGPDSSSDASFRELLRSGALDDRKLSVQVPPKGKGGGAGVVTIESPVSVSEMVGKFQELAKSSKQRGAGAAKKRMTVKEARPLILEQEVERLMDGIDVVAAAVKAVEESGIVFIDEIDKICSPSGRFKGADASAEGVQRDLLPLIEGSTVSTKHGDVKTDYVLFIASGAFHTCKPSDLLAELQGRLPIRVTLDGLTEDDMYRILTEPVTNLVAQQVELMATEGISLQVDDNAIREIAKVATEANRLLENIGARRLHTIVERIMEELSFEAPDMEAGSRIAITKQMVQEKVGSMLDKQDLSKYIL